MVSYMKIYYYLIAYKRRKLVLIQLRNNLTYTPQILYSTDLPLFPS